jgi:PAS domain S-box-containing protein
MYGRNAGQFDSREAQLLQKMLLRSVIACEKHRHPYTCGHVVLWGNRNRMASDFELEGPGYRPPNPADLWAALETERNRLTTLFTNAPAMIAVLRGPDHIFEFANPEYCASVRHPASDLIGKPVRGALPEYEGQAFFEQLDEVYLTGEVRQGRNRPGFDTRPGVQETKYYSYVFQPSRNPAGEVDGIMIFAYDVSEGEQARLRIEELAQLAQTEQSRLRTLLDNIPAGVLLAEAPGGRILVGNRQVEEILRRPIDYSAPLTEFHKLVGYHADGRRVEPSDWPLARALAGETVAGDEIYNQRGDGTRAWVRISAAPIYGRTGEISGAVVVLYDIDRQKRAEEARRAAEQALAESERQFRLLAESMPQLVWTSQPDGYHDYFNQRWYEYMGSAFDDTKGEGWSRVLHPDDRRRTLERWRYCLRTGEDYEIEYRYRRASDGAYRWFLGRAVALRDSSGRVVRWFGTCTDIHDQKLSETALRRSNEDLEQFAYAASHDLQEPLRMVAIYSQLLQRRYAGKLDSTAEVYIGNIVSAAQRMEMLLNDLRAYMQATSPPDSQEQQALCDASQVLDGVLASLEAAIGETGAVIRRGNLPVVAVEEVHLQQILLNLVGNAVKYHSGVPPQIEVGAQKAGSDWLFTVSDNGIGIDPKYARQIFGVFKRLHGQNYPGTGIGLAICQKIVERYGGHIWVKSELGKGSTFFFTIPAAEDVNERRQIAAD